MQPVKDSGSPTIRLQTVLFMNDADQMKMALESAVNSMSYAKGTVGGWRIVFGDCSPTPVLDESSQRAFGQIAETAGGTFEYRFFDENLGHGGGHNKLHEDCEEVLTLILNPDGIIAPNTVLELVRSLTPDVGIVDARQLPMEHPKQYDSETGVASWSSLACALTWSHLFRELGGIDHHTFPMYCDDVDYSWRLRLAGYEAKYCPQARMFHDKRIDRFGVFQAGETEKFSSADAALLLAYKYSRDDVVKRLLRQMESGQSKYELAAVEGFAARRLSGRLPERVDPARKVAEFTGGTYGHHRF